MRAAQMFRRNEGSIQDHPYFNASARVVGWDDASDDGTLYGNSPEIFRVEQTEYTENLHDIISKCVISERTFWNLCFEVFEIFDLR